MAKNISLLGADYPDVPAVQLPQTGGGTATFYDVEVTDGDPTLEWETRSTVGTINGTDLHVTMPGAQTSANTLINALSTKSGTPQDDDYFVSQYAGGGTTTTTYHRRKLSKLWDYIKGKILGYTQSGKNYPIQSGTDGLYVNVPWSDTTYSAGDGLSLSGTTFSEFLGSVTVTRDTSMISSSGDVRGVRAGNLAIITFNTIWTGNGTGWKKIASVNMTAREVMYAVFTPSIEIKIDGTTIYAYNPPGGSKDCVGQIVYRWV